MAAVAAVLALLLAAWVLHLRRRLAATDRTPGAASEPVIDAELLRSQAAATERERIYNDLHDDLGARLLQLIYEAPTPRQADLARALMQDLRDVVTRSRGAAATLEEVLSDIRVEATQRLAAVGTVLSWQQPDALPDRPLPPHRSLHLYRIVREAISNALRHAPARKLRMRIRASGGRLDIELTDDGAEGPPQSAGAGRGMRSMRDRAGELQGEINWLPGTEGGTKVLLTVPLDD